VVTVNVKPVVVVVAVVVVLLVLNVLHVLKRLKCIATPFFFFLISLFTRIDAVLR
jgi:hypothetical protein